MQRLELKATHKPVQDCYAALRQFDDLGLTHETAVRSAFQVLLDHCARQYDWALVTDQCQLSTDKGRGITNDPNRPDDPDYILRLLGQVITVSLETAKVMKGLPVLGTGGTDGKL